MRRNPLLPSAVREISVDGLRIFMASRRQGLSAPGARGDRALSPEMARGLNKPVNALIALITSLVVIVMA